MILTREVIETEWNVIVQSTELCMLGLITWISAWSLGLITWKWQNRRETSFCSSVTGGRGDANSRNGKRAYPRQHFPTRNGPTWVPCPWSGAVTSRRTSYHPCWRTRNEGEGSEGAIWPERKGLAGNRKNQQPINQYLGRIGKINSQGRQWEKGTNREEKQCCLC